MLDIRRIYDEHTFKLFYDELLYPNFGMFTDDLDTLETFNYLLSRYDFLQVYVAFDDSNLEILGGVCFEHFSKSKCTLLTYLVVKPEHQRKGIASSLIKKVLDECKDQHALFLETNISTICPTTTLTF